MPQSMTASCRPRRLRALEGETISASVFTAVSQLTPLLPEQACVHQSVATSGSSHLSKQAWPPSVVVFAPSHLGGEQTLEGGRHAEVGSKPKLSCATKEEELKPLCSTVQAMD